MLSDPQLFKAIYFPIGHSVQEEEENLERWSYGVGLERIEG